MQSPHMKYCRKEDDVLSLLSYGDDEYKDKDKANFVLENLDEKLGLSDRF